MKNIIYKIFVDFDEIIEYYNKDGYIQDKDWDGICHIEYYNNDTELIDITIKYWMSKFNREINEIVVWSSLLRPVGERVITIR